MNGNNCAAPTLGIDPARIGVWGQSTGGNLAASPALLDRDRAPHRLALQMLGLPHNGGMFDQVSLTARSAGNAIVAALRTPHDRIARQPVERLSGALVESVDAAAGVSLRGGQYVARFRRLGGLAVDRRELFGEREDLEGIAVRAMAFHGSGASVAASHGGSQ